MFDIKPADAAPIWRQIEEGMRRLITLGTLAPGASVPSVRDLARDLRVNPATVSRAYQRLTEAGVLSVKRGDGTYVADEPAQLKKSERNEIVRDAATRYAGTAISAGVAVDEAVDELEAAYQRLGREHRRRA
jgi:DNA-binding transcriptional regulator YhcF (GntR family)